MTTICLSRYNLTTRRFVPDGLACQESGFQSNLSYLGSSRFQNSEIVTFEGSNVAISAGRMENNFRKDFKKYIFSMRRRYRSVIKAKGGHTKY